MSFAERLRGIVRHERTATSSCGGDADRGVVPCESVLDGVLPSAPQSSSTDGAADALGGEWQATRNIRYLSVERQYDRAYRFGAVSVEECLPLESGEWPGLRLLSGTADTVKASGRMLFVDLETTGLAGGAGTCAFLVGIGWFEGASFRIRQFFLTSYAAERALLEDVSALVGRAGTIITYNGRTFDVPLIDTRFAFHRMPSPLDRLFHLDMLHPARRLWRPVTRAATASRGTCRLSDMEAAVLGHVRQGDVPGFEIPFRYFQFIRSGDVGPLRAVLEHNRLDLLALAMLTATAANLLHAGPDASRSTPEALGLGKLYERNGRYDEALACFRRAAAIGGCTATEAEALRACGVLLRRTGEFDQAADAWRRILDLRGCPTRITREAADALAVHHEHRLRDFRSARRFAVHSLQLAADAGPHEAALHRVIRLDRKLKSEPAERSPLLQQGKA
jgi:uncharacterized protein YprB with RNaseH-like and TPR domain